MPTSDIFTVHRETLTQYITFKREREEWSMYSILYTHHQAQGGGGRPQVEITHDPLLFSVAHSVGDPDPHVFGPPGFGSGSISQRYGPGSGFGSLPFLINGLSGLK